MGSNSTGGMDVCERLFSVLRPCDELFVQGVLQTVYRISKLKERPRPNKKGAVQSNKEENERSVPFRSVGIHIQDCTASQRMRSKPGNYPLAQLVSIVSIFGRTYESNNFSVHKYVFSETNAKIKDKSSGFFVTYFESFVSIFFRKT
jgi:hypothetical protein